jgi:peptide/nickel transport system substrate-binding protein
MEFDRRAMLGAAASLAAVPAWAQASGTTARQRTISAMMTDEPAHLNYPLFNTRIMQEICGNIQESLLLFDWQFKPHPNLARAFEMTPDGMRYTFHLRPDVRWHDGVPFTARDVVFSCGTMLPQLNPRSRNAFSHVRTITAVDRYTVRFDMKQPFNAFLLSLMASSAPIMPAHIFEGTDFRTNPRNFSPVGTGPFRFNRWVRGQYIHLTRNPHYWRKDQPGMDGIYYRVCPTSEQRLVAMESGAADFAMADGGQFAHDGQSQCDRARRCLQRHWRNYGDGNEPSPLAVRRPPVSRRLHARHRSQFPGQGDQLRPGQGGDRADPVEPALL